MTIIAWLISCTDKQKIQREIQFNDDQLYILNQRYKTINFLLSGSQFTHMMYRSDAPQNVKDEAIKLEIQYRELLDLKHRIKDSIEIAQHAHDSLYAELIK
jgi:hypothetical protein